MGILIPCCCRAIFHPLKTRDFALVPPFMWKHLLRATDAGMDAVPSLDLIPAIQAHDCGIYSMNAIVNGHMSNKFASHSHSFSTDMTTVLNDLTWLSTIVPRIPIIFMRLTERKYRALPDNPLYSDGRVSRYQRDHIVNDKPAFPTKDIRHNTRSAWLGNTKFQPRVCITANNTPLPPPARNVVIFRAEV